MRLTLVKPDLTSHVLGQQSKMKMHHDKRANFREMAVGDTVLARDHLSSQKWQPGIVRQHSSHTLTKSSCRMGESGGVMWMMFYRIPPALS